MPAGMRSWFVSLTLVCLLHTGAAGEEFARIGFSDLETRRVEGATRIVSTSAVPFSELSLLITVDAAGNVIDARPNDDNPQKVDPAPALDAVKRWRFRPPTFEGEPVIAVGPVTISYALPEDPPDASVTFPSSKAADTEITLERAPCYGWCPDYKVSIRGDGVVRFSTTGDDAGPLHHNVLLPGNHLAHIDPAAVAALAQRFRAAHFFGLKPTYEADATDLPTQTLTFRAADRSKRVEDYAGENVGMPASVSHLEEAVDAVAGSDRWVTGNPGTVALLETEGFDFQSDAARNLAISALRTRSETAPGVGAMIQMMIEKGLPLDRPARPGLPGSTSLGALLAMWAAEVGDAALLEVTRTKGYLGHLTRDELKEAFSSDMGCNPDIPRALAKAGADPKAVGKDGTALMAIRVSRSPCQAAGEDRLVAMARTLIELGVPPDARNQAGDTALIGCNSPGLAKLLIEHGVDVNEKDRLGTTALSGTDDDRVALLLLRAGADPRVGPGIESLRQEALRGNMPATLTWLDANKSK